MQELAAQYKYVKFLTIPSTECIPNYPDENLPTLLVYHDGQCKRTIVGTRSLGDSRISPESEELPPARTCAIWAELGLLQPMGLDLHLLLWMSCQNSNARGVLGSRK